LYKPENIVCNIHIYINRKYTAKVGQDNVNIGVVTTFLLANTSLLQVYYKPEEGWCWPKKKAYSKRPCFQTEKKREEMVGVIG